MILTGAVLFIAALCATDSDSIKDGADYISFLEDATRQERNKIVRGHFEVSGTKLELKGRSECSGEVTIRSWFDFADSKMRFDRIEPAISSQLSAEFKEKLKENPGASASPADFAPAIKMQRGVFIEDGKAAYFSRGVGIVEERDAHEAIVAKLKAKDYFKWFDVRGVGLLHYDDMRRMLAFDTIVAGIGQWHTPCVRKLGDGKVEITAFVSSWKKVVIVSEHEGFAPISMDLYRGRTESGRLVWEDSPVERSASEWFQVENVWLPRRWSVESAMDDSIRGRFDYEFDWKSVNEELAPETFLAENARQSDADMLIDGRGEKPIVVGPVLKVPNVHENTTHGPSLFLCLNMVAIIVIAIMLVGQRRGMWRHGDT